MNPPKFKEALPPTKARPVSAEGAHNSKALIQQVHEAKARMDNLVKQYGFDPAQLPDLIEKALRSDKVPARHRNTVNAELDKADNEIQELKAQLDQKTSELKARKHAPTSSGFGRRQQRFSV